MKFGSNNTREYDATIDEKGRATVVLGTGKTLHYEKFEEIAPPNKTEDITPEVVKDELVIAPESTAPEVPSSEVDPVVDAVAPEQPNPAPPVKPVKPPHPAVDFSKMTNEQLTKLEARGDRAVKSKNITEEERQQRQETLDATRAEIKKRVVSETDAPKAEKSKSDFSKVSTEDMRKAYAKWSKTLADFEGEELTPTQRSKVEQIKKILSDIKTELKSRPADEKSAPKEKTLADKKVSEYSDKEILAAAKKHINTGQVQELDPVHRELFEEAHKRLGLHEAKESLQDFLKWVFCGQLSGG